MDEYSVLIKYGCGGVMYAPASDRFVQYIVRPSQIDPWKLGLKNTFSSSASQPHRHSNYSIYTLFSGESLIHHGIQHIPYQQHVMYVETPEEVRIKTGFKANYGRELANDSTESDDLHISQMQHWCREESLADDTEVPSTLHNINAYLEKQRIQNKELPSLFESSSAVTEMQSQLLKQGIGPRPTFPISK